MKYPKSQFEILKNSLVVLSKVFENINEVTPCQLQYLVYQQGSEGQTHNWLFINENGEVNRGHIISGLNLPGHYTKLLDFVNEDNFPLYPAGCNDSHVETAVKKALSEI